MSKLRFLVALITQENDYQTEQAAAARAAAKEAGVDAEIIYADNDAITQSTQVLKAIQADPSERPNGIILEPLGATAFPQAAYAAVQAGIGWAVLSRRADYARDLARTARAPIFSVSTDQVEVGRILARQVKAILPRGGSVLYIQGPSVSPVSQERHTGMMELLPPNVHLTNLRGRWTEESAYQSVCSWFKLMAAQKLRIDLVLAQNDVMGMGAKKAIAEVVTGPDRDDWLEMPILGCDGVPKTGQAWVRAGQLTATVIVPPSADRAVKLMADALSRSGTIGEHIYTSPVPFPEIASLTPRKPAA